VGSDAVVVEPDGPVLTVTLNRPDRKNAIDVPTWDALREAIRGAELDEGVRAMVLTGSGGDFCAGADLSAGRAGHPLTRMHRVNDVALALHEMSKPVIAKVRGVAVGAGWNLALGCDLVVAATDARFSQVFAKRGLSLDFGGSWLLPRIVGLQQAKRLALLGEVIDAAEARELGLVTWVKEDGELDAFVDELASELATGAPVAIAQSKEMLNAAGQQTFRESLESEARAQSVNFATADAPAAFRAFANKTEPEFTGEWLVD
jgi:enoyl-CoA hydratase/carnithine racemase